MNLKYEIEKFKYQWSNALLMRNDARGYKMKEEVWYHVAYLDGKEIYRGLIRPDVEKIKKENNCQMVCDPTARLKAPEIIYKFKRKQFI